MANPKSKILPQIFTVYLFVLVAHCADVLLINELGGDSKIFGTNLYGHVVGIIIIFVACMVSKRDIRSYGLVLKPKRIAKGFVKGAIFSVIPIVIVALLFELIYLALDFEWAKISFIPPNINYSGGIGIPKATAAYAFSIAISVFMKELVFRGYMLKYARPTYPFFDANIIQAFLCIPLPLVNHLKNFVFNTYGDARERMPLMVAIAVFYIVTEFMMGIKWGLLARVSRDIWPMFFGHYIYNFFGYCLFFQTSKISNWETMVKLFMVEVISFIMVWFYYKKKRDEKAKKMLEKKLASIERHERHEKGDDNYGKIKDRNEKHAEHNDKMLESFSHDDYKKKVDDFSDANLHRSHHHHHSHHNPQGKDENLMDLNEVDISNFYKEYAKEMERKLQKDKESVKNQINDSE